MHTSFRSRVFRTLCVVAACVLLAREAAWAQQPSGAVQGLVVDPLGARVAGAVVRLIADDDQMTSTTTDTAGAFSFDKVATGRYRLEGTAPGFSAAWVGPFFVGASPRDGLQLTLAVGPFAQETVVSASAAEQPHSQVGASVTVVELSHVDRLTTPNLFDVFRRVPGSFVVQTGARGGATSLFLRGGNSGFAKVIIDGVPVNEIGGAFNFGDLQTTGVERIEVLRGPNSVLYGPDAMTGVVTITTARGRSTRPSFDYATEGGSWGTLRQTTSVAGAAKRFEYYSSYSHLGTDNALPNSRFENETYAGRFGLALGSATDLGLVVRRHVSNQGVPNAVSYFGLADDSSQHSAATIVGVSARSRLTRRLTADVRLSSIESSVRLTNPTPTGEPFDPFGYGANYLGDLVTIHGANGTSATGRAILDFGGTYPARYDSESRRRSLHATLDYQLGTFDVAGGLRVDGERGVSDAGLRSSTTRRDVGAFVEARAVLGRLFVNAGIGADHHTVFRTTVVPRLSVATYLRTATGAAAWGDTKLTFNAGKGVKAPSLLQELSSLYALAQGSASTSGLVSPLRPERSTGVDLGLEQSALAGRVQVNVTWFDNHFRDLIEYVGAGSLAALGVSDAAAAAATFGAYVNAQSYRARGLETSASALLMPSLSVTASYTYLSTRVTQSFDSSALTPAINPDYPDERIGAYSPLVGGRPFRRPAHTGSVLVSYSAGRLDVSGRASMSGAYDDSTFLSDAYFGNSLLLPNHNLGASYRRLDASGSWRLTPAVTAYATVENLFDARYEAASGYPALGRTGIVGLRVGVGGDRSPSPTRED